MYGTVARLRVKPGAEAQLTQLTKNFESLNVPGFIGEFVYRMDADANEYILVALFENKELYFANANSPEQDARYQQFRALLEQDPEWNDGEVVYAYYNALAKA